MAHFLLVKVKYVPRSMNAEVNLLSRISSSSFLMSSREIRIGSLPYKSIVELAKQMCMDIEPSWMDPLLLYLKEGGLPKDESEAREIKKKAWHFVIVVEELYKRSFSQPLLKCI